MTSNPFLDEESSLGPCSEQWMKVLSHELRTPLTAVVVALELLRRTCESDPAARTARNIAESGSRQMANIIEDMSVLGESVCGSGLRRRDTVE